MANRKIRSYKRQDHLYQDKGAGQVVYHRRRYYGNAKTNEIVDSQSSVNSEFTIQNYSNEVLISTS